MKKEIGILQEEYLELAEQMNTIMNQTQLLFDENSMDLILEYLEVIADYGNVLLTTLSVFGYEQDLKKINEAIAICGRCRIKEDFIRESENCRQALGELAKVTETLLKDRKGKAKICNCCGKKVYYKRLSYYYDLKEKEYGVKQHRPETLSKEEYCCPSCMASDRDRLIVAFLKQLELERVTDGEKILQIAPSAAIEHWLYANCPGVVYHSTDLYMKNVTFSSDIQNMVSVEDEAYDYFICSHVLEHVKDDKKALAELYRILKKDGIGIFLVPISLDAEHIDEEWGLSEEENWRRFGQGDHCRSYAKKEMIERLECAGFQVYSLGKDFFGEDIFWECGLTDSSVLYVLTKGKNLEELIEEKRKKRNILWKEPFISVILPTYNHEKYVSAAIESVLNQTYHNYEFLVADDGSEDGTVEEILKYEDRIDQIHLFDVNSGSRIVKFLQETAKGKYIAMMHSDDIWAPDKLRMQAVYLENHPECAACFTGCVCFNDKGDNCGNGPFLMVNKKREEWFRFFYEHGNCLAHPSILIHREMYSKLLKTRSGEMFRQLPDFWMWLNLIQESGIHIIEKRLTYFRVHDDGDNKNMSAQTKENIYRHLVEENYIHYGIIKNMDNQFFVKTFEDVLVKKDLADEKEIMCEKFFVLMNTQKNYYKQAAIFYLYEIYQIQGIPQLLEEQYNFNNKDIHRITGSFFTELTEKKNE